MLKKLVLLLLVVAVFVLGVAVGRYQVFPFQWIQKARDYMVTTPGMPTDLFIDEYRDLTGKHEVSCDSINLSNTMVALAFGQSNSANSGETHYASKHSIFNFYNGRCYRAADPLLGASSDKGSVWTRLGDLIVEDGLYDSVIFVTIGIKSTSVSRWQPDGDLFQRIVDASNRLDGQGLKLTHLFWHQGEADGALGTSKGEYKASFIEMVEGIRGLGIGAPLYLAIASRCGGPVVEEIQRAQRELVEERADVLLGANTDTLSDMDDRYDFCHFSDTGLRKHAVLWLGALKREPR